MQMTAIDQLLSVTHREAAKNQQLARCRRVRLKVNYTDAETVVEAVVETVALCLPRHAVVIKFLFIFSTFFDKL